MMSALSRVFSHRLLTLSAVVLASLCALFIVLTLVWQWHPSLVLRFYNQLTVELGTGDGQTIIDQQLAEFLRPEQPTAVCFQHIMLDRDYHTEGASVADINNDGRNDILAGNYWYQAPDWQRQLIHPVSVDALQILRPSDLLASMLSPVKWFERKYSESFFVFPSDINQDGHVDSIVMDRTGLGVHWYQNPGKQNTPWQQHSVVSITRNESPLFVDLLGRGNPQLLTGVADQSGANGELLAIELASNGELLTQLIVDKDQQGKLHNNGALYSHGLGVGDINGDGLMDVIFGPGAGFAKPGDINSIKRFSGGGWYEQTFQAGERRWILHPIDSLIATSQIHVTDVNGDGKADLIAGSAHNAGLFWFEQTDTDHWRPHLIDASYTQLHALAMADIDGDGEQDLITGKTWLAHFGRSDPDEFEPAVLYWYRKSKSSDGRSQFVRHLVSDDVGVGRQITVADVNGDGRKDIVIGNRNGVHVFLQDSMSTVCGSQ